MQTTTFLAGWGVGGVGERKWRKKTGRDGYLLTDKEKKAYKKRGHLQKAVQDPLGAKLVKKHTRNTQAVR
jgi:hypothetical protein